MQRARGGFLTLITKMRSKHFPSHVVHALMLHAEVMTGQLCRSGGGRCSAVPRPASKPHTSCTLWHAWALPRLCPSRPLHSKWVRRSTCSVSRKDITSCDVAMGDGYANEVRLACVLSTGSRSSREGVWRQTGHSLSAQQKEEQQKGDPW